MKVDNFLIEDEDIEKAKRLCGIIDNASIRNKAVANVIVSGIAKKFFESIDVDTDIVLHKLAPVLEDLEIFDIYLKDSYIDVRIYFEGTTLCVPKEHFEKGLLPVAYMFVKLSSDISEASITGFAITENIDKSRVHGNYYEILENDLVSYYDLEPLLVSNYADDIPQDFEYTVFEYLDGRLKDTNKFYATLLSSKLCREVLLKSANAKNLFKYVSLNKEVITQNQNINLADENQILELEPQADESSNLNLIEIEQATDTLNENILESAEENLLEELQVVDENFDLEIDDTVEDEYIELDLESSEHLEIQDDIELDNKEFEVLEPVNVESTMVIDDLSSDSTEVPLNIEIEEFDSDLPQQTIENVELDIDLETTNIDLVQPEEDISFVSEEIFPVEEENSIQYEDIQKNDELEIVDDNELEFVDDNESVNVEISEFSTTVTPSVNLDEELNKLVENDISEERADYDSLEEILNSTVEPNNDSVINDELENDSEGSSSSNETVADDDISNIDELFVESSDSLEEDMGQITSVNKKKNVAPILGLCLVVAGLGYFGYTKFVNQEASQSKESMPATTKPPAVTTQKAEFKPQDVAMPIETIENIPTTQNSNEGNAISIPAIEQNLDASILVSNLSVNWEVPTGYLVNNSVKRYFTKMGKIIQLNLKTELLLLTKPPITNKIVIELEFDKANNKFKAKRITTSSGETVVDDLILRTVNNALDINLKSNLSTISEVQGSPALIIRL